MYVDAKYKTDEEDKVTHLWAKDSSGREYLIPKDPDNRYYAEILKQVKEGTLTIKDAD